MLSGTIIEKVSDRVRSHPKLIPVDDFELAVEKIDSTRQSYRQGALVEDCLDESVWISLRVLHRKCLGHATAQANHEQIVDALIEATLTTARESGANPWFQFPLWRHLPARGPGNPKPTAYNGLHSLFQELAEKPLALEEHYEMSTITTQILRKTEKHVLWHSRQQCSMDIGLLSEGEGNRYYWLGEKLSGVVELELFDKRNRLVSLVRSAKQQQRAIDARGFSSKSIIFHPQVMAKILQLVARWFCADEKKHPKLQSFGFSPCLTLLDCGSEPSFSTTPFDLEGVLTQKTVLIEKGTLTSLLYDAAHARLENRPSTGNYRRSPGSFFPTILPNWLVLAPSEMPPGHLLKQTANAFVFESLDTCRLVNNTFLRLEGSGYYYQSDFTPVYGLTFECAIEHFFERMVAVGNDLTAYDHCSSPSVLIEV